MLNPSYSCLYRRRRECWTLPTPVYIEGGENAEPSLLLSIYKEERMLNPSYSCLYRRRGECWTLPTPVYIEGGANAKPFLLLTIWKEGRMLNPLSSLSFKNFTNSPRFDLLIFIRYLSLLSNLPAFNQNIHFSSKILLISK